MLSRRKFRHFLIPSMRRSGFPSETFCEKTKKKSVQQLRDSHQKSSRAAAQMFAAVSQQEALHNTDPARGQKMCVLEPCRGPPYQKRGEKGVQVCDVFSGARCTCAKDDPAGGQEMCVFRAMAVVPLWRSAGKRGPGLSRFFCKVPTLHPQLWCLLLLLSDGG